MKKESKKEPKTPLEFPMDPEEPHIPVIPMDDSMWPFTGAPVIETDPLGSWTGRPENLSEVPVQDADDL